MLSGVAVPHDDTEIVECLEDHSLDVAFPFVVVVYQAGLLGEVKNCSKTTVEVSDVLDGIWGQIPTRRVGGFRDVVWMKRAQCAVEIPRTVEAPFVACRFTAASTHQEFKEEGFDEESEFEGTVEIQDGVGVDRERIEVRPYPIEDGTGLHPDVFE